MTPLMPLRPVSKYRIHVFYALLGFFVACPGFATTPCAQILGLHAPDAPRHLNATIAKAFSNWLKARSLADDSLSEEEKAAYAGQFVEDQRRILRERKTVLQEEYFRVMAEKRQAARNSPRTVRFRGTNYPVVAHLGNAREGAVDLVRMGDQEVVIKYFFDARQGVRVDPMYAQSRLFQLVADSGQPAARMLGVDLNSNRAMLLSFAEGVVDDDIARLTMQNKISVEVQEAYRTLHAMYYNQLMTICGEQAAAITFDPGFFNPHRNNVSYNPATGEFAVFDFN